jgi:pimeloyl-ACP methyl ester carboxylesterase
VGLSHLHRGRGEPLVLIHGIGSRWQVWDPVLDALAAQREVVALDLPGFGASPVPRDGQPRSVPELARSACRLLDKLGWDQPHVAGHSLGGGVALELGRTGRARSVTAVAPVGFWSPRESAYARAILRASRRMARTLEAPAATLLRSGAMRTMLLGLHMAHPARMPAEAAVANLRGLARCRGFEPVLEVAVRDTFAGAGEISCPVTVAWPCHDRLLLVRQAERARRVLGTGRHIWLTGCGHTPFWDDAEQATLVLLAGSGAAKP